MTPALTLIALLSLGEPRGIEQGTTAQFRLESVVSTKTARRGDPVRLRTVGPMTIAGVSIPPASEARGVVADVKRPGRVRGRGELEIVVVAITQPDGSILPVTARSSFVAPRRRLDPRVPLPSPVVPILAGMLAGYGTAALVSRHSDSAETIAGSGVVVGLATGVAVGVLKRGEDLVLHPGLTVDAVFERVPSLP